jgi:hypothetical protein
MKNVNLNMNTRTTIINTVFLAKLWYVAAVVDFTKNFFKQVDSIIFSFLWRSTEWIARNVIVNPRFRGGLGVTHVKAKVKAMRLMHLVRVLKDPDKVSSVLARRWTGLKMRDWFLVTPTFKTVFVLNVKGFYKTALEDFKICTSKGKEWM